MFFIRIGRFERLFRLEYWLISHGITARKKPKMVVSKERGPKLVCVACGEEDDAADLPKATDSLNTPAGVESQYTKGAMNVCPKCGGVLKLK